MQRRGGDELLRVLRADDGDDTLLSATYGFAHGGCGGANTSETQFAIASGTKGLTALAVVRLVEAGALGLETTAHSALVPTCRRSVPDVTVEHLLAHRCGRLPLGGVHAADGRAPLIRGRPRRRARGGE